MKRPHPMTDMMKYEEIQTLLMSQRRRCSESTRWSTRSSCSGRWASARQPPSTTCGHGRDPPRSGSGRDLWRIDCTSWKWCIIVCRNFLAINLQYISRFREPLSNEHERTYPAECIARLNVHTYRRIRRIWTGCSRWNYFNLKTVTSIDTNDYGCVWPEFL